MSSFFNLRSSNTSYSLKKMIENEICGEISEEVYGRYLPSTNTISSLLQMIILRTVGFNKVYVASLHTRWEVLIQISQAKIVIICDFAPELISPIKEGNFKAFESSNTFVPHQKTFFLQKFHQHYYHSNDHSKASTKNIKKISVDVSPLRICQAFFISSRVESGSS